MALGHTILAALSIEPLSGYDLAKKFADKSGCYWKATQQQIYRELAKLEDEGMVISETIPQAGRPDKKLYHITDSGRENLCEWIAQPSEPTQIREDLMVKVLAGHLVPRPVILKELERRRQIHLEQLSIYKEWYQKCCENVAELSLPEQCRCLTLRRGIRYETEWVAWCEEAMQLLNE
ncbi:PadR family transcriptional regulator [Chroococcidiopsis sp. CCNUC1]|uniref:PadR family transcriptional regulator n=1 Tax=Chroococcidiopsis sp. CCNUC1 TaxID=2653189 RepID=UPI00202095E8|nr:PadR family transcriptional regulator [Chroococcidiopsis sp. CCNUC1]URD49888.1 PadR family transcriptional regulator [Chroococcidiopsis sp. CCNUC1]